MDEDVPASEAYEHSELLLYKARILEEGGQGWYCGRPATWYRGRRAIYATC